MAAFGDNLRTVREERGLTQQELADFLGVTVRTYQHYEAGNYEPSFDSLISLCEKLDVSSDCLLGIEPLTLFD